MIGTTDKTVFTRLAEVLRKRIVTMIAAFGSFQKNKVNGKLGFSIMCQEFPIYLSLAVSKPGDDKTHTKMEGMKMPIRYVCEMFIDRVSASKNYQKEKYTDKSALEYYEKSVDHYMIHPDTKAMLEYLLVMLSVKGEEYTYSYIKKEVLKGHIPYEKDKINQLEQGLHV